MKTDKEWLKNEINALPLRPLGFSIETLREEYVLSKDEVLYLIDLLDEPQKPIIPQFVANYIEKYKGNGFSLGTWLHFTDGGDKDECDTVLWLYGGNKEEKLRREYLLLDAIRYGYEVEKDPHYHVAFEGEFNLLYVTRVDIYGENGKFNYNSEFDNRHALKFTDKSKAEYLADFLGATVVKA